MTEKIIPNEFIPDVGGHVVNIEGQDYYVQNDVMYTFYQRSLGELSRFFMGLKVEKKIYGNRCTRCGIVRVPPMMQRCPDCDFAPVEWIEVDDVGEMLYTPPITYFGNSLFQKQVPFGRGRVLLRGTDTAMSVNVYTTQGILVPGLIRKGTEVKVVFRDERRAEISDIFCVPTSELTSEQIEKKGLLESEIQRKAAAEPALPAPTQAEKDQLNEVLEKLASIVREINECPRAKQDIAGWKRSILVKTKGGAFGLEIDDGEFALIKEPPKAADFTLLCEDAALLVEGLGYHGSFTQDIMEKKIWISKNEEFLTIFKLERMARSLARSKKG